MRQPIMRTRTLSLLGAHLGMAALVIAPAAAQAQAAAQGYSLRTVDSKPIPSKAHYALWKEVALGACQDAKNRFNLERSECLSIVSRRSDACIAKQEGRTPAVIRTSVESKNIGREFMHCATPYYFCHGVEVKTETEALAKCK